MTNLFDIKEGKVVLSAYTLAIPPFKKIYESYKDKSIVEKYISYIVFANKWNTPYLSYGEDVRASIVKSDVFGNKNEYIPKDVIDAEIRYNEFQHTELTRLLSAARSAVEYLIQDLNSANTKFNKTDANGRPIISAIDVVRVLEKIGPIVKSLDTLEKAVIIEQSSVSRVRGDATIGQYEIPKNSMKNV